MNMSKFPSACPLLVLIVIQLVQPSHHHPASPPQPPEQQQQQPHQQQLQRPEHPLSLVLLPPPPPPNLRRKRQTFDFSMNTPPPLPPPPPPQSPGSDSTSASGQSNASTPAAAGSAGGTEGNGENETMSSSDLEDFLDLLGGGGGGGGDSSGGAFGGGGGGNGTDGSNSTSSTDNENNNDNPDIMPGTNTATTTTISNISNSGSGGSIDGGFGGGDSWGDEGDYGEGGGDWWGDYGPGGFCFECLFHPCENGGTCVAAAAPPPPPQTLPPLTNNSTTSTATSTPTDPSPAPNITTSNSSSSCRPSCNCPPPYDDTQLYDDHCKRRVGSPSSYPGPTPSSIAPPRVKDCMGDGAWVCEHGYCSFSDDDDGSFDCQCDPGWTGLWCDEGCAKNCSNNGTCIVVERVVNDGGGGGAPLKEEKCTCPPPWVGPYCTDLPPVEETDRDWIYWLGGSLGVGLLLLPIVALLFMYFLWKKRMVFAMKFVFYFKPYEDNDGLRYDAFVSYVDSPDDVYFAHNILLSNLENDMGFKLCLQHRDFDIGGAISDNIIQTLEDSRRFILVLSPHYLKCEWAQFEYLRAFHEMLKLKIRIVPIIMEDFTSSQADNPTLRTILESTTHIKYPGSQASQREIDKFWKRVHLSMPKIKKQKEADVSSLSKETWSGGDPAAQTSGKAPPDDVQNPAVTAETNTKTEILRDGVDNKGFEETLRSRWNQDVYDITDINGAPPTEPSDIVAVVSETQSQPPPPPPRSPSSPSHNGGGNKADHCTRSMNKSRNIFTQLLKPKRDKQQLEPVTVRGIRPLGDASLTTWNKPPAGVQTLEGVDGMDAATNQKKELSKAVEELEAKLESSGDLPSA